jgi:hypothetical protein
MIEILGYLAIGFVLGRMSKCKFYCGYDEKKFQDVDFAILLNRITV